MLLLLRGVRRKPQIILAGSPHTYAVTGSIVTFCGKGADACFAGRAAIMPFAAKGSPSVFNLTSKGD